MPGKVYKVKEFFGIDQSVDESRLDLGWCPDARNMDTSDGNLTVAKGYVTHLSAGLPGILPIKRLYVWRDLVSYRYVVIAADGTDCEIYAYVTTDETPAWRLLYSLTNIKGLRFDFVETKIGTEDHLIIACGEHQLIKWDGEAETAALFGTAAKVSDIKVNFLAMHYSRLFSAGDPENPSRLYWSCVRGDGRSIEDWSKDTNSENTSGGFVEVGNTATDPIVGLKSLSNQLLIFKRDSIYRLLGDRPSNYRVLRVDAEVEEMVNSGCVIYGDTPFWLTLKGTYYFDGQTARTMYNARAIKDILSEASIKDCTAAEHRNIFYFVCKFRGESIIITYNVDRRSYMVRDGFDVTDIHAKGDTLYMINQERVLYRFNEGRTYGNGQIKAYWQTPLTDMEDKSSIKGLRQLSLRTGIEKNQILLIKSRCGKVVDHIRVMLPDNPYEVEEIPLKNEARTFSLRFENEAGGFFSVKGGIEVQFDTKMRPQ